MFKHYYKYIARNNKIYFKESRYSKKVMYYKAVSGGIGNKT
jgi:hypothetical protein